MISASKMATTVTLEKIISLCKQRGFVFPSSEIYGGCNGLYDFGPLGCALKRNIKKLWLADVKSFAEPVFEMDGAILSSPKIWEASGHVKNFSDPMVDCLNCKRRFRADELDLNKACPTCGVKNWTDQRQFMLMFQTQLGAMSDSSSTCYLRPETAQMVFVNFKNVMNSCRTRPPFGIAQIGKAFRNEITPKQFLFRVREFEQMELEFFVHPSESDTYFKTWLERREKFYDKLGLNKNKLRIRPHAQDELAHYSTNCSDVEYEFPFGWKELEGIAHRGDFDLSSHQKLSDKDLTVFVEATKEKYIPHVVECSVGVDRLFITTLFDAYHEEVVDGESRIVLKLAPALAPIKAAILPLVKKLEEPAQKLYQNLLKSGLEVEYDESGSIGKRYRRNDEIGTPFCITIDFQTLEDGCVTIRNRDDLTQQRINMSTVEQFLKERC